MPSLRVATCQSNSVVGDLKGNVERIIEMLAGATEAGADLAVFPELSITGYPPEDLLLKPRFIEDNLTSLEQVAKATTTCAAVVGFVDRGMDLFNAAAICYAGRTAGTYHKQVLPNYGVFDEQRYFASGSPATAVYRIGGVKVGVSVCEDAWAPNGPISQQANGGAELMLSINASPYFAGKVKVRERMIATRAVDASVPIVYVNQVGGQDELVFDGASMVIDSDGAVIARAGQFIEEMLLCDIDVRPAFRKRLLDPRGRAASVPLHVVPVSEPQQRAETPLPRLKAPTLDPIAEVYAALVIGAADYVRKNGFSDVVVGLSGGVDSALVATIAVDALGANRVHAVSMPSRYSSEGSRTHAAELAKRLGIERRTTGIDEPHKILETLLTDSFDASPASLTDENLQSRLRGLILMAMSNEYGWLVLTTGNKSELAVGYSTLYGDTAGGFAVIKDVMKTTVYELCDWRNAQSPLIPSPLIPTEILEKAPSAELRPDQTDQDSLPLYDVLDPILQAYIEDDLTVSEIESLGFDGDMVRRVTGMVDRAEYKRRQSPLGVRVTPKAFGKDRRVPITNAYRN